MFVDMRQAIEAVADQSLADRITASLNLDASGIGDTRDRFADLDQLMSEMASQTLPSAQEQFDYFWQAAGGDDEVGKKLLTIMPEFSDALLSTANQAGLSAEKLGYTSEAAFLLALASGDLNEKLGITD